MKLPVIRNKREKLRFGAVGVLNTAIDFGLYSILSYIGGLPLVVANFISTSAGFMTSFFLNRRFTFNSQNERKLYEFGRFLVTTLAGLWLLQPAIIYYTKALLASCHVSGIWLVVGPKAFAILVGLVWNYLWYSRFVFGTARPDARRLLAVVRQRLSAFRHSDLGRGLTIALLWQLVMALAGVFIQYGFTHTFHSPQRPWTEHFSTGSLLSHTMGWDGGWYRLIAESLYRHVAPAAAAFYPLFPFTVRAVQFLTLGRIGIIAIGLLVNTACLWLGLTALLKICREFFGHDRESTGWVLALFLSFPAAFFLHQFYTEAIFIALGFWAYYFALTRRWLAANVCLAFLTASRITSVLFIGLVAAEFWRAHDWSLRKTLANPRIAWFVLAPLGFVAYGSYLFLARHDFLAMFHAYRYAWGYQRFNPRIWEIIARAAHQTGHCVDVHFAACSTTGVLVNLTLPLIGLIVTFGLSAVAIFYLRGRYIPLGILGLLACVMFTLNSNLVSVHRYLLPVITTYLVTVGATKKLRWPLWPLFAVVQLCFTLQILLYFLFINGYFAG